MVERDEKEKYEGQAEAVMEGTEAKLLGSGWIWAA